MTKGQIVYRVLILTNRRRRSEEAHAFSSQFGYAKRNNYFGSSLQFSQNLNYFYGEFDSGSERTLAAWIRHASRTRNLNSLLIEFLVADGLVTREIPSL